MKEHIFKKKYGQNFLNDQGILQKIYTSINPNPNDLIIEVGPGSGNLTKWLQKYNCNIICYEIDESLKEQLASIKNEKTQIFFKDFLEADLTSDLSNMHYENLYVIANIPYYITTPIIKKITFANINPQGLVLMVQKEVADRLSAKPKTKDYGYITVLLNYFYDIKKLFNVSKNSFYPRPNVDSAIIKLTPNNKEKTDFIIFNNLIESAFQFKRKNLRNNLKNFNLDIISSVLEANSYSLNNRAEEIPIEVYIEISNKLKQ